MTERSSSAARTVLAIVLVVGTLLRIWQLAAGTSLWLDELALVRNVIHLPIDRLVSAPLEYDQMAPPGFLLVSRLLYEVFPGRDWAVRLLPLFSSVALLPLVFLLARRFVGPASAVAVTGLFALSPTMIALATVVKQYASDVLIATLLMYGAVRLGPEERADPSRMFRYGAIGGVLMFFSFRQCRSPRRSAASWRWNGCADRVAAPWARCQRLLRQRWCARPPRHCWRNAHSPPAPPRTSPSSGPTGVRHRSRPFPRGSSNSFRESTSRRF